MESHRLTFASFPILGYSLTSDSVPQNRLWEMATYDIAPRLNRMTGVATVIVQGGQEPEFQITPEPGQAAGDIRDRNGHLECCESHKPGGFSRAV